MIEWTTVREAGREYGWVVAGVVAVGLAAAAAFAHLTDRWPFHDRDDDQDDVDEDLENDVEVTAPP